MRVWLPAALGSLALLAVLGAVSYCGSPGSSGTSAPAATDSTAAAPAPASGATASRDDEQAHRDLVETSRFCGTCHPAIYAEHQENTHGRAFVDEEARLATRAFRRENCVRCHTPRPVFETGIGMTPIERRHDLEEGNTCMTCHAKAGYDYGRFEGGAECVGAFEDRVGDVQACASCHRIAATPEQWSHAVNGKQAGHTCIDCHMPLIERPVAVGGPTRKVRAHVFPASRSESQIHRAYSYVPVIEGNELVVRVTNEGAGHNFPTATQQRSLESLVVIRDAEGNEVTRTRAIFKHPYAQATGLELPLTTQIPSGQTREQRVPIHVADGTIECSLFFKLYYPIEDGHPTLSRRLEFHSIPFHGLAPSVKPVDMMPRIRVPAGAVSIEEANDPEAFAKLARPAPGLSKAVVPDGDSVEDIRWLVALLEYPVPEARRRARARLAEIGLPAVPTLVAALGHWSDDTFDQAREILVEIGEPAVPALLDALDSDQVYIRVHARMTLARMGFPGDRARARTALIAALAAPAPLDRRSAVEALGEMGDASVAPAIRPLLADADWDVVAVAAQALVRLGDRDAVPAVHAALDRATFVESRRDLAAALAGLGDPSGVPILLAGLDHPDDVLRRTFFDAFFAATGLHDSYDPDAPPRARLEALARLQSHWAAQGGADALLPPQHADHDAYDAAWKMVEMLGGGTDVMPGGDDEELMAQLVTMGGDAVPALIQGFTFPTGFTRKRALVCEALGKIGDQRATPYLIRALRDPNLSVAAWACWAIERTGDAAAVPALRRYSARLAAYDASRPDTAGAEAAARLIVRAARTRVRLNDPWARAELEAMAGAVDVDNLPAPAQVIGSVATSEAPPVPVPTSVEDALEKAVSLRAQDYYEDAIAVLRVAEDHFGVSAPLRLEKAWNLLMIAEEDMTRDTDPARIEAEVADARFVFGQAVRLDPHVAGRAHLEAQILRYEGHVDEARRVLEALVADHPDDPMAHQELGYLAYTTKDWATAAREYDALLQLQPDDGWAVLYRTMAQQGLGHPIAELDEGYLVSARMLPEVVTPLRLLCKLHANDPARALELLGSVIEERPDAVWARIWTAHVLRTQSEPDDARAEAVLREATAAAPKSQAAHFNLGALLEETGRPAEAAREYLASVRCGAIGDVAGAAEALDRLLLAPEPGDALPTELREQAWEAIVAKTPGTGRYAHDAGRWYADVRHDPLTARRYLEAAVAAEPGNEQYRSEAIAAKSDPRLGQ